MRTTFSFENDSIHSLDGSDRKRYATSDYVISWTSDVGKRVCHEVLKNLGGVKNGQVALSAARRSGYVRHQIR